MPLEKKELEVPMGITGHPPPVYTSSSSGLLGHDALAGPSAEAPLKKKKRKGLRKLAPAYVLRQTMKGARSAAGKMDGLTKRPSLRRDSVDPIKMAAGQASRETRRRTKELDALPEEEKITAPGASRTVHLAFGEPADKKEKLAGNNIRTAKYNVITFLPIFLFEMFSRVAYLYFLAQACLSWWNTVSPFGGFGSTAALAFVLIVAAIKALLEDAKRHQEDRRTNKSMAHVMLPDGSSKDVKWERIKVGQVLKVQDNELFPADLLCLYTSLPDKVCFIKTTNLDGESNLKIRRPVDLKESAPQTKEQAMATRGQLQCELPNANLHHFQGRFKFVADEGAAERMVPVTMNEMLLRGCMLKNTGFVLGLVVYTGRETRIQRNAAKTPNKIGSFDRFLNLQIGFVICLQLCMCLFCAVGSYIWRQHMGNDRYYLAMNSYVQGNYRNGFVYTIVLLITFWILFSYLVPISLFVTLEIVKFWQAFLYINNDREMKDPETGENARARNSNLNEDLGKVEYVFSDKTGTLTSNEMQLRELAIKGLPFGDANSFKLEQEPNVRNEAALQRFDARLLKSMKALQQDGWWEELVNAGGSPVPIMQLGSSRPKVEVGEASEVEATDMDDDDDDVVAGYFDVIQGQHLLDFWLNVCICHSLIVEQPKNGGLPTFQASLQHATGGPSPDEVALVEGGRQLGFEFVSRNMSGVVLRIAGHQAEFEVLNMMEFTSERGRMTVIARSPDGTIRLFCKGSDAKMLKIVRKDTSPALLAETDKNLHLFATQGLRTLVLGQRVLSEQDWAEWDQRYQQAAGSLDDRDKKIAECMREIEVDIDLIGVTAIEDKLQDGVPAAIQSLLEAGMKVWVITGDKQETAINIAISCKLIRNPDSLLICNADTPAAARRRIEDLLGKVQAIAQKGGELATPSSLWCMCCAHMRPLPADPDTFDCTGELVIDGKTLEHVLGTDLERGLALLGSHCEAVVICRASPSQKAAIVDKAVGSSKGLSRWLKHQNRRLTGKMLGIGDGANDVAMIQAADVGIGIMGKEGRQASLLAHLAAAMLPEISPSHACLFSNLAAHTCLAAMAVNNSDYAVSQFRFLVRLLLVHGNLSSYRLARLVKYSFYKNVAFAFLLFYFQFYNGFSGQALVDGISAAAYNVVFTSLPILLYAVLDRPVRHFSTLMRYPQRAGCIGSRPACPSNCNKVYNKQGSLNTRVFWKSGVLMAAVDAALAFFIPYYSITASDHNSITDVYSVGKTVFIALLGAVSLEVALVARYWTWLFAIFLGLSYFIVYPFEVVFPAIERGINYYDPGQYGVAQTVFKAPTFWFCLIVVYICCFGHRYLERAVVWLFNPQDNMILQEIESRQGTFEGMGWQTQRRLHDIGIAGVATPPETDPEDPKKLESSGLLNGVHVSSSMGSLADAEGPILNGSVQPAPGAGKPPLSGYNGAKRGKGNTPQAPTSAPDTRSAGWTPPELEMQPRT
eukprot:jgi/Astpho2/836/Aster-00685